MLGDGTVRGATLETCLAKVLHCSRELVYQVYDIFKLLSDKIKPSTGVNVGN